MQTIEPSPSAVASKIRNKAKQRAKNKTSLSFGAEEEVSYYFLVPAMFTVGHRRKASKSRSLILVRS